MPIKRIIALVLTPVAVLGVILLVRWIKDSDGDGMSNSWESHVAETWKKPEAIWTGSYEITPRIDPRKADADLDPDNDGLSNIEEYRIGTRPDYYDTDGDSLSDKFEQAIPRLNPCGYNDPADDPDHDGMGDGFEATYEFRPDVPDGDDDADGDGLTNAQEAAFQSSPRDADIDADSLNDFQEKQAGTSPWTSDSDGVLGEYPKPGTPGDGLPDDWEIKFGLNPLVRDDPDSDADQDGLVLLKEYRNGTSPWNPDTDGDGSPDGEEVKNNTSPTDATWGGKPPSAPKNIKETKNPDGSTTYSWTDTSDNEEGFRIWKRKPDGSRELIADVPPNTNTITIAAPDPTDP